jgi:transposase
MDLQVSDDYFAASSEQGDAMRGADAKSSRLFSYVSLEDRVPKDHPLRDHRSFLDNILHELSPRFEEMYSKIGRPSIPPEQLLRALVIQLLYSIRSERLLMEQLDYNLLFRWFVGLGIDDPVWVPTVFSKNRDRLLEGDVAKAFLAAVVDEASPPWLRERRPFHGRRHVAGSLGQSEELPTEGRGVGEQLQSEPESGRGLPETEAEQ